MLIERHGMTGLGEEAVVFRASFLGSRFTSVWPKGNGTGGDGGQHFGDERILFAGSGAGGVDRCGKLRRDSPQIARRYRLALGRIKDLAFCAFEVAERPRRKFDGEVFQIPSLRQASAAGIASPLANCASDSSRAVAISRSSLVVSWAIEKRDSAVSLTMANSLGSASRR